MTATEVVPAEVVERIPAYLSRQRWYAGAAEPGPVRVLHADQLSVHGPISQIGTRACSRQRGHRSLRPQEPDIQT